MKCRPSPAPITPARVERALAWFPDEIEEYRERARLKGEQVAATEIRTMKREGRS